MKNYLAAFAMAGSVLAAAGSASAISVVGATDIRVTSALTNILPNESVIQVAELQAFDFGAVNVALAGEATALSQYSSIAQPNEAIDGIFPAAYDGAGIYHSLGTSSAEYLNIRLDNPTTLSRLTIYGRLDCCQNRDLFNVTIFDAGANVLFSGQFDARTNGFATVTFDAPSQTVVPEPTTWALMITGFGLAGAALRRRTAGATA